MGTITLPSDPISNGATGIQGTVFNIVPADYVVCTAQMVARFKAAHPTLRSLPDVSKGGIPLDWSFIMRKDMAPSLSLYRNLVGIRVTKYAQPASGFDATLGRAITVSATVTRIEAFNWYPSDFEMVNATHLTFWSVASVSDEVITDPETGLIARGPNAHRSVQEAAGFLFTQVAAGVPTETFLLNWVSGISPI